MPSTYTNNGIEKIAPGEQDNTWGDTTNTNWELVDEMVDGVITISNSSTTQTLTVTNGISSTGRHKVIEYTGNPTGTITVTITPSTLQKLYFIRNSTGTSKDIVFTQGSGGDVTVKAGRSAIIFCDGGGAAAKVTDFTNAIQSGDVQITGGTITGATISGVTITNDVVGNLTGDVTGDVTGNVTGNADTASQWATARTITLKGGATGSQSFDGSSDFSLDVTITDNSHNHLISNVSGLQNVLDEKAPLDSPELTGTPTAPTPDLSDDSTQIATTAFVQGIASSAARGFISFTEAGVVQRARNLSVAKLATGQWRITLDPSIRDGTSDYVVLPGAIGDPTTHGATFSSYGLDVFTAIVTNYTSTYFDIEVHNQYNTSLSNTGRGNDSDTAHMFVQTLADFTGLITVAVYM